MLNFYTYTDDNMWFEYEAKFSDGRLIETRPMSIYRNGVRDLQDRLLSAIRPTGGTRDHTTECSLPPLATRTAGHLSSKSIR